LRSPIFLGGGGRRGWAGLVGAFYSRVLSVSRFFFFFSFFFFFVFFFFIPGVGGSFGACAVGVFFHRGGAGFGVLFGGGGGGGVGGIA